MNKLGITIIIVLAIVAILSFGLSCNNRQSSKNSTLLRVGMMSGWAPFMVLDTQGQPAGFDVDVAHAIANKLGRTLEIIDFGSLAPLLVALEQNKIDCIFSGLDITKERQNKFIMVPYFGTGFSSFKLLFWEKIPAGIQTINDLALRNKPIIAVEPGSASEKFLNQFNFIEQKPLASTSDMLMDVKYGHSLAAILEPLVAKRVMKQVPELKALAIPITEEFRVYGMGIALRKDQQELAAAMQQAVITIKPTIMRFAQRWQIEQEDENV